MTITFVVLSLLISLLSNYFIDKMEASDGYKTVLCVLNGLFWGIFLTRLGMYLDSIL